MPTLADSATRATVVSRIAQLSPDAAPAWGRMTAPQMLAHCADGLRMAYGDLPCAAKNVPLARLGIVKWLMLNVIPFPKGAPTARELIARAPAAWGDERESIVEEVAGRVVRAARDPLLLLNDAAYNEIKRLEAHPGNERGEYLRFRELARSVGRMSEADRVARLDELARRYARDVAGNFNPRVFSLSTNVVLRAMWLPAVFSSRHVPIGRP
jgi:hypothetical protein